VPIVVLV